MIRIIYQVGRFVKRVPGLTLDPVVVWGMARWRWTWRRCWPCLAPGKTRCCAPCNNGAHICVPPPRPARFSDSAPIAPGYDNDVPRRNINPGPESRAMLGQRNVAIRLVPGSSFLGYDKSNLKPQTSSLIPHSTAQVDRFTAFIL